MRLTLACECPANFPLPLPSFAGKQENDFFNVPSTVEATSEEI